MGKRGHHQQDAPDDVRDSDYYRWTARPVTAQGHEIAAYVKPGMLEWASNDPARLLLAENLQLSCGERLLDLNCGSGLVAAVALHVAHNTSVIAASSNAVDLAATRQTLAAATREDASRAAVSASGFGKAVHGATPADVVSIRLLKGKIPALRLVLDAYHALRPGGRAYLAGGNSEGIKTYLRQMGELFGGVETLAYRKGHRVGVAIKAQEPASLPPVFLDPWMDSRRLRRFRIEARGDVIEILSRPGVFSWDRLDPGTQALMEAMEIDRGDSVLDLGCGYGIVGFVAARLTASGVVHLVDASVDAVEVTELGIAANGLDNCHVALSDCAQAVQDFSFDVIATNPPFHRGVGTDYEISRQFVRDAARLLKPGGRLYLVANRFLPYEAVVLSHLGNVSVIHQDNRFKVLRANRQA